MSQHNLLDFRSLEKNLEGSLHTDHLHKAMYATDASVYRMLPKAICYPKNEADLQLLTQFASENNTSLIMRAAGTSLAGQCVGDGIIVDMSRHFTKIIEINASEKQVRVQPGVIRDDLNRTLEARGLFFGPNTSTTNRCMIGGMVGNNSSGTTSIKYGVTRDKVVGLRCMLQDGSIVTFNDKSAEEFIAISESKSAEGLIYQKIDQLLSQKENRAAITAAFPKKEIHRRNTGYALDSLMESTSFGGTEPLNLSKLICGSEGTLAAVLEITLALDALPPKHEALIIAHYDAIEGCLNDVFPLSKNDLYACEMLDKTILDCTKGKLQYESHRALIVGDPKALLLLELKADSQNDLETQITQLQDDITATGNAYASPVYRGVEITMAMELRAAGLGLLGSMVGDNKAVACIEDTAVALKDLAAYIKEFSELMRANSQEVVYYAHAGAGELHLRPILNLKKLEDVKKFREITTAVAALVKKYKGSLSGEHGDGIVRGEFLPTMVGAEVYDFMRQVKLAFDPKNIFNPGKIIDTFKMDENLRYVPDAVPPKIETFLDFSESINILKAAEQCNGSGDCRKPATAQGTMCPSYHATRNEKDTTRARANVLREVLTNSKKPNAFDSLELKEVFKLCISCKACSSECPSNVNVGKFKAEFLYQYKKENGSSFSDKLFARSTARARKMSKYSSFYNFLLNASWSTSIIKSIGKIHAMRSLPNLSRISYSRMRLKNQDVPITQKQQVVLFVDEFSDYFDAHITEDSVDLLRGLGYELKVLTGLDSGRALLSKGFLDEAKVQIDHNVALFGTDVYRDAVFVGIEPSAILTYRDEALYMATDTQTAKDIATKAFLIEEFIANQVSEGNISSEQFTKESCDIKIHSHCYQKALSNQKHTFDMLNLPSNYKPTIINSGCCGMAGSFGYEKDHYEVSMTIGEQRLFKSVRKSSPQTLIAANGTSCRHQIKDGTGREALHPVTILKNALLLYN